MMVTDLSRGRPAPPAALSPPIAVAGNAATAMSRVEAEASIAAMRRHIDTAQSSLCNANTLYVRFVDRRGWKVLGYASLDECRRDRFSWMSERSWWRHVDASRVSENLGLSDARSIPVTVLEPLARVPAAEQAGVWAEATGGDPDATPTRGAVDAAVDAHLEGKDEALAKLFADAADDGTITRTIVGRETGDDDEEVRTRVAPGQPEEAANPEDDFVAGLLKNEKCPYHDLDDVRRRRFVAGAIAWFRLQGARKAYQVQLSEQSNGLKKSCPGAVDPYLTKQTYMIGIRGPQQWTTCSECGGTGRRVVGGATLSGCLGCDGAGWKV